MAADRGPLPLCGDGATLTVGLPIGLVLSGGEAHNVTAFAELMEQRDSDPGAMLADKGYDSDAIRHDLCDSGAAPEIPTKRNRKVQ